jgi:hypothetical protein
MIVKNDETPWKRHVHTPRVDRQPYESLSPIGRSVQGYCGKEDIPDRDAVHADHYSRTRQDAAGETAGSDFC